MVTNTNCCTPSTLSKGVTGYAISDIPRPINHLYFLSGAYNLDR